MTRAGVTLALALAAAAAAGCAVEPGDHATEGEDVETGESADEDEAEDPEDQGCLASDEAFVHRALLRLQGRAPRGVRETRLLASYVAQLDAAGLDGRRALALGLTEDPRFLRRWGVLVEELLELPRDGGRAMPMCHAPRRASADDEALARHVRDHAPHEPFSEPWGLGDLIESSLRLDDLTPVIRARLLTRMIAPVQGNNVTPEALERARRTNFGRSFEAVYLGRRGECLACHNGEGSVTDAADPDEDRFWPHPALLERAVYGDSSGRAEEELHAAFRYAGFAGAGSLAPWGAEDCGALTPGYAGDLLGVPPYLAGPLPPGATALDVEERLQDGLERLRAEGPLGADAAEPVDPAAALATMVAMRLVDSAWAAMAGARLTMAHGFPRNEGQQRALLELTDRFVSSGFSARALAVELVVHPALNQATPDACPELEATPLAALFDPYAPERDPERPGNGLGDALHNPHPLALLDRASHALDWATPNRFPHPYTWEDEALLRGLGLRMSEEEPGHRGLDWGALLMWESRISSGSAPSFSGPRYAALEQASESGDFIDALLDHAYAQPDATLGELVIAVSDRLLCAPRVDADERALFEQLVQLAWETPVGELARAQAEQAARQVVGVLLSTPDFMIAGLYPETQDETPRLALPADRARALCERRIPALLAALPDATPGAVDAVPSYTCDDAGVTLRWESSRRGAARLDEGDLDLAAGRAPRVRRVREHPRDHPNLRADRLQRGQPLEQLVSGDQLLWLKTRPLTRHRAIPLDDHQRAARAQRGGRRLEHGAADTARERE